MPIFRAAPEIEPVSAIKATSCAFPGPMAGSLPETQAPSLGRKLWRKLTMEARSLPYLLGLKEPCKNFRNVEIVEKQDG